MQNGHHDSPGVTDLTAPGAPLSRARTHGLDGVVAVETRLSQVDGQNGVLIIGGYELEELAGRITFEEAALAVCEAARKWEPELSAVLDSTGILQVAERHAEKFKSDDWTWSR